MVRSFTASVTVLALTLALTLAADEAASDTAGDAAKKAPAPSPASAGSKAEIWWVMLSRNHECSTEDNFMGDADTVEECAMRCAVYEGCQYFIFGHGDKQHQCYHESTTDGCQSDGSLVENEYSLYQIKDSDVNNQQFQTLDAEYLYYRMIVLASRGSGPNASFCVEDIVFYDGNNTPIDTAGPECSPQETVTAYTAASMPSRACCMSTAAIEDHGCANAFDASNQNGWFCSQSATGFLGYQFETPT